MLHSETTCSLVFAFTYMLSLVLLRCHIVTYYNKPVFSVAIVTYHLNQWTFCCHSNLLVTFLVM